ncbi:unnamed protein product [Ectocarpus sp. 12 AP-2014]
MPDVVSVEYLNSINVTGTPPHKLNLKVGALVFFIKNINLRSHQCQTGSYSRDISRRVIDVEVLSDESNVIVQRICFDAKVGASGITFHHYQFPVRLCYSMTINRSQGQTLSRPRPQGIGLLPRSVVRCRWPYNMQGQYPMPRWTWIISSTMSPTCTRSSSLSLLLQPWSTSP